MEFEVRRSSKKQEVIDEDSYNIALSFSKQLVKEVHNFVKGIVLFGSVAKRKNGKTGDIDVLVIVDDLNLQVNEALVQGYRIIVKKLVSQISPKLHITTLKYTTFWDYIRAGDPVGMNILRDGLPIVDKEFFEPLQKLLRMGRIRPTPEAIWAYQAKVMPSLENSKSHLLQAAIDLYWATVDASHAALMRMGEVPPSPEDVPHLLQEKLVKTGLLKSKYSGIAREFYHLSKHITHRDLKELSGEQYDHYFALAKEFCDEMKKIVEK